MLTRTTTLVYAIITFLTLICSLFAGSFLWLSSHPWLDLSRLTTVNTTYPTRVLDKYGAEICRFSYDRRSPVPYHEIPDTVIKAFLAAEDHLFFEHTGISWRGIVRSVMVNLTKGRKAQGGSTITQQLVKLVFTDGSRTFKRKIKEQLLALILEHNYSKTQILEAYLNHIYFGCGIYGVATACERFFGKKLADITCDEAATLAACVKSPGIYCPLISLEQAQKRRNVILECMARQGYISAQDATQYKHKPLLLYDDNEYKLSRFIQEYLRKELEALVDKKALYTEGFVVQTTLDTNAQHHAEKIFAQWTTRLSAENNQPLDGAVLSIDGKTGGIHIMIGGKDATTSRFNRIFARRQMGSIFKPLVFTAALENNLSLRDIEVDEPVEIETLQGPWCPRNVNKKFLGPLTRAYALALSNNIVSIKTALATGLESICSLAQRCHLPKVPAYPSLALGCIDGTPYEAVGMFNIFAQRGVYVKPYLIEWIKDRHDKKIYHHTIIPEQCISWEHASQIARVLQHNIQKVRARVPDLIPTECIGKTGTATQATTLWYAGATPERTTVVYLGRDDNAPLGDHIRSTRTAFPLWLDINQKIPCTQKTFVHDPALTPLIIDGHTGEALTKPNNHSITILTKN